MAHVAVVGTGYVGLTVGVCFAHLGHDVVCADIDVAKVDRLNAGIPTISEPGVEPLLHEGLATGRLRFVLGAAQACRDAEFHFLCLPTPSGADGSADLTALLAAVDEIRSVLPEGSIVVNKSTVPIGSADLVSERLARSDIAVASNPEFLREGAAVDDFLRPDRVVVGSSNPEAAAGVGALYSTLGAPVLTMEARSAEMVKYAANAMLAVRLSFVNEIAELCVASDVDVAPVIEGVGLDHRIGSNHLTPGPGWGGSCFPKDSLALMKHARDQGTRVSLVEAAVEQNRHWISSHAAKVADALGGGLEGARIGMWGMTFKANTDDQRDSPALAVLDELIAGGATVRPFDPTVVSHLSSRPTVNVAASPIEAATGVEVLIVMTEWPQFTDVSATDLATAMAGDVVIDTRNVLDRASIEAAGLRYHGLGERVGLSQTIV